MATRAPPVERLYLPEDLATGAPRLYVWRDGEAWRLEDEDGTLLSTHSTQSGAIDAVMERSKVQFSDILVRGDTGEVEWLVNQDPAWERLRQCCKRAARRHFDVKNLRFDTGLRLICTSRWLIPGREAPIQLFYDPEQLKPGAPRLRIAKNDGWWELRDDEGALLSSHPLLPDALDAAFERSATCYSEILVAGAAGRRTEWSAHHNPEWVELARLLNRTAASQREAAD